MRTKNNCRQPGNTRGKGGGNLVGKELRGGKGKKKRTRPDLLKRSAPDLARAAGREGVGKKGGGSVNDAPEKNDVTEREEGRDTQILEAKEQTCD